MWRDFWQRPMFQYKQFAIAPFARSSNELSGKGGNAIPLHLTKDSQCIGPKNDNSDDEPP
jgi:hypothetical protein